MISKNSLLKKTSIVVAAAIAAISTIPYGYHFANVLFDPQTNIYFIVGIVFASTSYVANVLLGTYSLLNVKEKATKKRIFLTAIIAILGAIPMGFLSFYAYRHLLHLMFNLIASVIVILVNSGINYTAVKNLLNNVQHLKISLTHPNKNFNPSRFIVCTIGFIIGLLVSVTMYLATSNGIATIAISLQTPEERAVYIASLLAIITWIPLAALYSNSNQTVIGWVYDFFKKKHSIRNLQMYQPLLVFVVILSGTALAQMVLEFYNPDNYIPEFFKTMPIQYLSKYFLMPLTLFSSAAVNFFALSNIFFRKK